MELLLLWEHINIIVVILISVEILLRWTSNVNIICEVLYMDMYIDQEGLGQST